MYNGARLLLFNDKKINTVEKLIKKIKILLIHQYWIFRTMVILFLLNYINLIINLFESNFK